MSTWRQNICRNYVLHTGQQYANIVLRGTWLLSDLIAELGDFLLEDCDVSFACNLAVTKLSKIGLAYGFLAR